MIFVSQNNYIYLFCLFLAAGSQFSVICVPPLKLEGAVDDELILSTLKDIMACKIVKIPEYDFITHSRYVDHINLIQLSFFLFYVIITTIMVSLWFHIMVSFTSYHCIS